MAEIVNLRRARKTRAREDARRDADENAARHGRTRGRKTLDADAPARISRLLDGAKREDADEG